MSKLFFDHLLTGLDEINEQLKKVFASNEEREEAELLVEERINSKVLEKILDKLPKDNHEEFLLLLHKCPHDEVKIFGYLKGKAGEDIENKLKEDLEGISREILREISSPDEINTETRTSSK
jgi:hypothetical protein